MRGPVSANGIGMSLILWLLLVSMSPSIVFADAASEAATEWQVLQDDIRRDAQAAELREQAAFDATQDAPEASRVVAEIRLRRVQFVRGQDDERALARMRELGDRAATLGRTDWAILAWRECSRRHFGRGDYDLAQSTAQRILDAARKIESRKEEAQALNDLGVLAKRRGDIRTATIHYENALVIRRSIDDVTGMAQTLGNLALIEKNRGDLLRALAYQREAHPLFVQSARESLIANSFDSMGLIWLALDDAVEAERQFREAIRIGDLPNNQDQIVNSRVNLSLALLEQGRVDEAETLAQQVFDHATKRGLKPMLASANLNLAILARRKGALDDAQARIEKTLEVTTALGDSKEIIEPLIERSELRMAQGRAAEALVDIDDALALTRRDQLRLLERQALEVRSRVLLATGDGRSAFQARLEYEQVVRELAGSDTLRRMAELMNAEQQRAPVAGTVSSTGTRSHRGPLSPVWLSLATLGLVGVGLLFVMTRQHD